jgi:hypothetical protein
MHHLADYWQRVFDLNWAGFGCELTSRADCSLGILNCKRRQQCQENVIGNSREANVLLGQSKTVAEVIDFNCPIDSICGCLRDQKLHHLQFARLQHR